MHRYPKPSVRRNGPSASSSAQLQSWASRTNKTIPATVHTVQNTNDNLITHYPQPSRHGTKQEHTAVSAGLNDGAQQGAISKGAQRGPVCCSLRNRGSVPGGGDALALAIRLCLPGLRRGASQLRQDPGALPVYRLSTADIRDRRNDFRGDQGAAMHLVSRHVPPHSEQGRHLQH